MLDRDISTASSLRHLSLSEHALDGSGSAAGHPFDGHHLDRRRFLQLVGMGAGAGLAAGPGTSVLDSVLADRADTAWAAGPIGPDDGIVVVVGMYGGNDGLNTVVPINDGRYYDQHGALAIAPESTLAIDSQTGLNPALTSLKNFWDAGQLAIVEGIGYPNPDLSHFNSMANWMAAQVGGVPTSGWLGRWLDGHLDGRRDLFAAAEIGESLPLHLLGRSSRGTTVPAGRPSFGAGTSDRDRRQYSTIRAMNRTPQPFWAAQINQAMVDQLDLSASLRTRIPENLPPTEIVARLEVAAHLINANLGFRVLTAGWGDFDSHAGQPYQHGARMTEFNDAVNRFYQVLNPAWANRVIMMTFSEFGRTSFGNDGQGTDHGTAAPHFVFGPAVKGGRYGRRPTLAGLQRWDRMVHHVDFRDFYGSVVDGWLGGGGSDVVGRPVDDLALFRRAPTPAPPPTAVPPPGEPSPGAPPIVRPGRTGDFVPLSPTRIVDTRDGTGGHDRPIGPKGVMSVVVPGVPAGRATAVVVNVTAANTTSLSFLTTYPAGEEQPRASSLNTTPERAVSNLVTVGVSANGRFDIANEHGSTDCIVDLVGYFTDAAASRFTALVPARLLDTRPGGVGPQGVVAGGTEIDLAVLGRSGVPGSGVTGVIVNVTSVNATELGFVKVYPSGEQRPPVSSVNYSPGLVTPNLVMCKLGAGGKITLYVSHGTTDLLVDVIGCFTDTGARFTPMYPQRVLDTRTGRGAERARVGTEQNIRLDVVGSGLVPAAAQGVMLNVAAVAPSVGSFITVYPDGADRPEASNLNMVAGQTVSNLVVAKLGTGGRVKIFNRAGTTDIIADVTGYFL